MYKLACKDVDGNSSCDFETNGVSVEEVVDVTMEHAKIAHSGEMAAMGVEEADMRAAMAKKVVEMEEEKEEETE